MDLAVIVGEGDRKRKLVLNFAIRLCNSTFRGILRRSFLARLDVVSSLVDLKETYHEAEQIPVVATADVDEVKRIKEFIQKVS